MENPNSVELLHPETATPLQLDRESVIKPSPRAPPHAGSVNSPLKLQRAKAQLQKLGLQHKVFEGLQELTSGTSTRLSMHM